MAVNPAFALKDFGQGIEFQVLADGRLGGLTDLLSPQVFLGGRETVGHEGGHPHPSLGKSLGVFVAPVGLLNVFSQGEFDGQQHR